jgi:hypothetical protein
MVSGCLQWHVYPHLGSQTRLTRDLPSAAQDSRDQAKGLRWVRRNLAGRQATVASRAAPFHDGWHYHSCAHDLCTRIWPQIEMPELRAILPTLLLGSLSYH